jgi:hypothetical protein
MRDTGPNQQKHGDTTQQPERPHGSSKPMPYENHDQNSAKPISGQTLASVCPENTFMLKNMDILEKKLLED